MQPVLIALGLFFLTASWLHLIRHEAWWIRIFDFPHLQLLLPLAAIMALYGGVYSEHDPAELAFLAAGAVTCGYHLYRIRPYTRLHKPQVLASPAETSGDSLKLIIFNVFMENRQSAKFVELVLQHQPDVVMAVETDRQWQQDLMPLEAHYPYRVPCPLPNTYGLLFYSRLPLAHHEVNFLVQDDIPSIYVHLTLPSGRVIDFYGVHPRPPAPAENTRSTERDVELIQVGKRAKAARRPVIVAGDLNDVAWSHTTRLFQRISGLLDPRIGRGFFNTFHAKHWLLRWPLDHVFVSYHFKLMSMCRLPNCGSDHFPILAQFHYQPDPEAKEQVPQATAEDYAEAREKEAQLAEE